MTHYYRTTYLALLNASVATTHRYRSGIIAPFEEALQRATADELERALAKLETDRYAAHGFHRQTRMRARLEELRAAEQEIVE